MERLNELLNSTSGQTTFELGTGESVSPVHLRENIQNACVVFGNWS